MRMDMALTADLWFLGFSLSAFVLLYLLWKD